jgi:hypothetical protein
MTTVLVDGFAGAIVAALRTDANEVISISDSESSDHRWAEVIRGPQVVPGCDHACLLQLKQHVYRKHVVLSDMYSRFNIYHHLDAYELRSLMELHIRFAADLFMRHKPDAVIFSNIPHEGYDYVMYLVAEALGISRIVCYQSIFPNRFWIMKDGWDFRSLDERASQASYEGRAEVPRLYYMDSARSSAYTFRNVARDAFNRPELLPACIFRWQRALLYRWRDKKTFNHQVELPDRFVYFPLQLQPELTTSALGGHYSDQLLAIEHLRDVLADDVSIVVKENPKQSEFHRGRLFFERLRSIPRVVPVSRLTDTHELTKNCIAVATISGTAGWEALLAGKPVICFGNAWYSSFSGVHRIEEMIRGVIPSAPDPIAVRRDFSLRMSKAYQGVIDEGYVKLCSDYDAARNAELVARALMAQLM